MRLKLTLAMMAACAAANGQKVFGYVKEAATGESLPTRRRSARRETPKTADWT